MIHEDTTEHDVALDVLAALEMYEGSCGSEATTIDDVIESGERKDTLIVTLSNGDSYWLQVRARA